MFWSKKSKAGSTPAGIPALRGVAQESGTGLPLSILARMHEIAGRVAHECTTKGTIVELGCRAGLLSLRLATELPGRQFFGLDPSTDLVRKARIAARETAVYERAQFDRSDLTKLPFPDRQAALVIGIEMLTRTPSLSVLLAEAQRILAPGGKALFLDLLSTPEQPNGRPTRADLQAQLEVSRRRVAVEVEELTGEAPGLVALWLEQA